MFRDSVPKPQPSDAICNSTAALPPSRLRPGASAHGWGGISADRLAILAGVLALGTSLLTGCTTTKMTTTARSATEQLLLSTATDHALQKTGLDIFAGRVVYVDTTYFDSYDPKYVLGSVRDALSRSGARLTDVATNAEFILEVRSGTLAIDESDTLLGLPSIGVPLPLAGTVQTPEIAFYKSERQRSYAKFSLLAYNRQSLFHIYSSGPLDGQSFEKHSRVFFYSWNKTDVPEKQDSPEDMKKAQTWFPQYDREGLGDTNAPAKKAPAINVPATSALNTNTPAAGANAPMSSTNAPTGTNAPAK